MGCMNSSYDNKTICFIIKTYREYITNEFYYNINIKKTETITYQFINDLKRIELLIIEYIDILLEIENKIQIGKVNTINNLNELSLYTNILIDNLLSYQYEQLITNIIYIIKKSKNTVDNKIISMGIDFKANFFNI